MDSKKSAPTSKLIFFDVIRRWSRLPRGTQHALIFVFGCGRGYIAPMAVADARRRGFEGEAQQDSIVRSSIFQDPSTLTFQIPLTYKDTVVVPRKICLSPDQSLLLVLGAVYQNASSLLVYRINRHAQPPLGLIFNDLSLTYVDVTFTPDSAGLMMIPHPRPGTIVILNLPSASDAADSNGIATTFDSGSGSAASDSPVIVSEARKRAFGPLSILGPVMAGTAPVQFVGLEVNPSSVIDDTEEQTQACHFVAWTGQEQGEYYLWRLGFRDNSASFDWERRVLSPLQDPSSPKVEILGARFSKESDYVTFAIHRYFLRGSCSFGITSIHLPSRHDMGNATLPSWFSISEVSEPVDFMWSTNSTYLAGDHSSFIITAPGLGVYEYVPPSASLKIVGGPKDPVSVQGLIQPNENVRYWVDASNDLFIQDGTNVSSSLENANICEALTENDSSLVGNLLKLGYEAMDLSAEKLFNLPESQKKGSKKGKSGSASNSKSNPHLNVAKGEGIPSVAFGISLSTCLRCGTVLLRPLRCGRCKCAHYCSKDCQRAHWTLHKQNCTSSDPAEKVADNQVA